MALLRLWLTLVLLLGWSLAHAGEIAGENDPRFGVALDLWLEDDEATALPELAALAREGNRAAQVLLAIVDETAAYQGPWLAGRARQDRMAMMRAPGGLSGRSWMEAAAGDTPLARLWLAWQDPESNAEPALVLAALGEMGAAKRAFDALSRRQYRDLGGVADDPRFPSALRYLLWQEWVLRDGKAGRARAAAEIATRSPLAPEVVRFTLRPVAPDQRDAWLATAAEARPLRALCNSTCPSSVTTCLRAAEVLVNPVKVCGEAPATPLEALVPTDVWIDSARGRLAILRNPMARAPEAYILMRDVSAADACLGAALSAETARFYQ